MAVTELTMKAAITKALAEEMRRNPNVIILGENVHFGSPSGAKLIAPLFKEFGAERVVETPVSENAIIGGSLGLSLGGMVPVAEIFSADFVFTAGNELFNDIPKWAIQHGLEEPLPLVLRGPCGVHPKGGGGPEHSQCPEAYFLHCPGMHVVMPGTPGDAYGLMRTALRCGKPVIYFEHRRLYDRVGPVPDDEEYQVPLGQATVVTEGNDVTLVAWAWLRSIAEAAVEKLAHLRISAELIDPRSIAPLDLETISRSCQKTGRIIVIEESTVHGGVGSEIVSSVLERAGGRPFAAKRLGMPHAPHPYDHALEESMLPRSEDIVSAAIQMMPGSSEAVQQRTAVAR